MKNIIDITNNLNDLILEFDWEIIEDKIKFTTTNELCEEVCFVVNLENTLLDVALNVFKYADDYDIVDITYDLIDDDNTYTKNGRTYTKDELLDIFYNYQRKIRLLASSLTEVKIHLEGTNCSDIIISNEKED